MLKNSMLRFQRKNDEWIELSDSEYLDTLIKQYSHREKCYCQVNWFNNEIINVCGFDEDGWEELIEFPIKNLPNVIYKKDDWFIFTFYKFEDDKDKLVEIFEKSLTNF